MLHVFVFVFVNETRKPPTTLNRTVKRLNRGVVYKL